MATWETSAPSTIWRTTTGALEKGSNRVSKITDEQSDNTLAVNESVKVSFVGNLSALGPRNGKFLGTVTVDAESYLVVELSSGLRYIVGLDPDTPGLPSTLPDSRISAVSFVVCFFPGTMIATPSGECKVEELACGDLVLVGESRTVPVKWIGRQSVSTLFGPADRLMPIRFAAGSLGGGGATPSTA